MANFEIDYRRFRSFPRGSARGEGCGRDASHALRLLVGRTDGSTGEPVNSLRSPRKTGSGGALLTAALTVFIAAAPIAAQTPVELVANSGQPDSSTTWLSSWDRAQGFTTGGSDSGYTLTSVEIAFDQVAYPSISYDVSIHATPFNNLSPRIGSLAGPCTVVADSLNTFTSSGIHLQANSTYFVVIRSVGGSASLLQNTDSDSEDSTSQSGWRVLDGSYIRSGQFEGNWYSRDSSVKIRVNGYAGSGGSPNNPPVFSPNTLTRSIPENTAAGENVGNPVVATDADGDTLTYTLQGADATSFSIISDLGQIQTKPAVNYDFETKASYSVHVKASDSVSCAIAFVTISVSDVDEAGTGTGGGGGTSVDRDGGGPPADRDVSQTPAGAGSRQSTQRNPQPLQVALWTDKPGYRSGETVRLYYTIDPHDDRGRYRVFVYQERAGGGERRYLAPLAGDGALHAETVDHRGLPVAAAAAHPLQAVEKTLAWEGAAGEAGVWQFVLDLRPEGTPGPDADLEGEPEEERGSDQLIRRAWAKLTIAEGSQLLNRRGFDRMVDADLTLRSDTIYYLGHQLFVREGATLRIEPGTLVLAWGRSAAIIVEPGGRIVAEGTPAEPVVLTCSLPVGSRQPGCWGGLRVLGKAPVARLKGFAAGIQPTSRALYGGSSTDDSSGVLRYLRVEFAGAGDEPGTTATAIGFYGVGSGTAIEHVQTHASRGNGITFSGGTATCEHCVASGSGAAGLAWQRGWRGAASHLYVQHAEGGMYGVDGANDEEGPDREPRSLPTLSNATLVHSHPYGKGQHEASGVRLRSGTGVTARDLLVARFGGGAIVAGQRAALLFREGESSVANALLYANGSGKGQIRGGIASGVTFIERDPKLRDVRYFANPDPRPQPESPALEQKGGDEGNGSQSSQTGYLGAFGTDENWLEEWTFFGAESDYDTRDMAEAQ